MTAREKRYRMTWRQFHELRGLVGTTKTYEAQQLRDSFEVPTCHNKLEGDSSYFRCSNCDWFSMGYSIHGDESHEDAPIICCPHCMAERDDVL